MEDTIDPCREFLPGNLNNPVLDFFFTAEGGYVLDFGEVSNFASIDYSLKDSQFLCSAEESCVGSVPFHLGAPIWAHKPMLEKLNAKRLTPKNFLQTYSGFFNSIELNSSYYAVPGREQIERWREQTPKEFLFFPKAPKSLTFSPSSAIPARDFDGYLAMLESFGSQRGDSFLQFSPHFSPENKRSLFQRLELLPTEQFCFHIELRHPGWFSDQDLLRRLSEYLAKRSIGFVVTDTPGRRDVLHMIWTAKRAFVRFKGNDLHSTDFSRLKEWTAMFTEHIQNFESIAFFHHHSDEQHCVKSSDFMNRCLGERNQCPLPQIPEASTHGEQVALF